MKYIKQLLILFLIITMFIGCDNEHNHEYENYICDCGEVFEFEVIIKIDNDIEKIKIKYNTMLNKLEEPVKEGYKFIGWYKNDTKYDFNDPVIEDFILEARFEKIYEITKYQINFVDFYVNTIYSLEAEKECILNLDEISILLNDKLIVNNNNFIGWKDENGLCDETIIINNDKTIYSVYEEIKKYNVIFLDYDGRIIETYESVEGELIHYPKNPNREYFTFDKWLIEEGELKDNIINSDIAFKASYKPIIQDYTIEYDIDESLWYYHSKEEMRIDFLNDFYDFVNPEVSRYAFIGLDKNYEGLWINYLGGSLSNINKLLFSNDIDADNEDYFLNSKEYKDKWYNLAKYVRDNICKSNKRFGYPENEYKYGALDFKRYLLDDPGTYINTYGGEEVFYKIPNDTEELVKTYTYNDLVNLKIPKSELFSGWYLDENFTDGPYERIDLNSYGNKKFYAKILEKESYILSFDTNGGSYLESIEVNYGDEIYLPVPEKIGYEFKGWYLDNDLFIDTIIYKYKCSNKVKAKWYNPNGINLNKLEYDGKVVTYRNSLLSVDIPDVYEKKNEEFRAVWVSSMIKNFTPSPDEEIMKSELLYVLDLVEYYNMNAIIFHLRTHNNAYYPTDLAPIEGAYGSFSNWNYLPWFIDECHNRNIEFHAWLNPYRIQLSGYPLDVTAEDVAKEYKDCPKNPAYNSENILITRATGGKSCGAILNPAKEEVQNHINEVCMEIIRNYDIDGIHFDDYFYAKQGETTDILLDADQKDYLYYINNNVTSFNPDSATDKKDWRRMNVDNLIYKLKVSFDEYYKETSKKIIFGIAPTGIYKSGDGSLESGSNTVGSGHYGDYLYSDTLKWIKNGWIDYIMPQSYVSFTNPNGGFADRTIWWNKAVEGTKVKLFIGMGISKAIDTAEIYSWRTEPLELINQLLYLNTLKNVEGVCFFSFHSLKTVHNDEDNIANESLRILKNEFWTEKINTPKY